MKHLKNDRFRCSRNIRNPTKKAALESELTFHNVSCGDTSTRSSVHINRIKLTFVLLFYDTFISHVCCLQLRAVNKLSDYDIIYMTLPDKAIVAVSCTRRWSDQPIVDIYANTSPVSALKNTYIVE